MGFYSQAGYRGCLETAYQSVPGIRELDGKCIVITGARGLIGSFLTDLLLYCMDRKGFDCQVHVTGRSTGKLVERFKGWETRGELHFHQYELGQPVDLETFPSKADYVIHCAGSGSPAVFMDGPAEFMLHTVIGAYNLLEYAQFAGAAKCLFVSSGEVYGCGSRSMSAYEEDQAGDMDYLSPRTCYPMAKRAAEHIWAAYGREHHMSTVIARACHTYGPTALDDECRIAGLCLEAALHRDSIELKSEGKQRRSWCYVADCVSGLLTILLKGETGQAYNVAPDDAFTISEMAGIVAALSGKKVVYKLPTKQESQNFNPMESAVLSPGKLNRLGWRNRYSLYNAIEITLKIMKYAEVHPDE